MSGTRNTVEISLTEHEVGILWSDLKVMVTAQDIERGTPRGQLFTRLGTALEMFGAAEEVVSRD